MLRLVPALLVAVLLAGCGGASGSPIPATSGASTAASPTPTRSPAASSATASLTARPPPSAAASSSPEPPFAWTRIDAPGPAGREDHTWTLDEPGASAYLFGGRDAGMLFDDLWRYDLAADRWERLEPEGGRPEARFGHGAAWLPGTGLVVWSGQAGSRFFADLWAFDPDAGAWRQLPSEGDVPPARYGSCLAVGPDGRLWISHGFTQDAGRFSDTRAWDPASGAWKDETPGGAGPVVRCLHDCLWTPDGRLLVYAGQTTGVPAIGDLWALESGRWTQGPAPEPAPRQLYGLAQAGDAASLFGGGDVERQPLGDLWRLDLGDLGWSRLEPEGESPSGRIGSTLLADAERGRLLLFGGHAGSGGLSDLWTVPLR